MTNDHNTQHAYATFGASLNEHVPTARGHDILLYVNEKVPIFRSFHYASLVCKTKNKIKHKLKKQVHS